MGKCLYKIYKTSLFVLLLAIGFSAAQAAPWGVVDPYIKEDENYTTLVQDNHTHFALHHLLSNTPLKYAITFETYPGQTAQTDEQWAQRMIPLIQAAFDAWPQQTLEQIDKAARQKDLKDIVHLLKPRRMPYTRVAADQADIVFNFINYKGAAFYYDRNDLTKQKNIRLPNPAYFGTTEEAKLPNFLLHEIGHYYGLGDRYQEGIGGNSPTYSTTGDTDGPAIMASSLADHLTDDDADGFINLIDLTLFLQQGKFPKRAQRGWKGLSGKMYARAKELNRSSFYDGRFIYFYNPDGTVHHKQEARLYGYYNPLTEPQAAQGPFAGVQTFSSQKYSMQTRLDYTPLAAQKRFTGQTNVANLVFLTLSGVQKGSAWQFTLDYKRSLRGNKQESQQIFVVTIEADTCRVQAPGYMSYIQKPQATFNLATQQLQATYQARDERNTFGILQGTVSGSVKKQTYVIEQGGKKLNISTEGDNLYTEYEDDENLDFTFFVDDSTRSMMTFLKQSYPMCQYAAALSHATR